MKEVYARLILKELELWFGLGGDLDSARFVDRAVTRLPRFPVLEESAAKDDLVDCGVFDYGRFLTLEGRSLAWKVGAAIDAGLPLPPLPPRLPPEEDE